MDKKDFKKEIEREIENLERLSKEMKEIIERIIDEADFIETRAAGSILHDFYCGMEKIFERIAVKVDSKLPGGEDWHRELLLQMGKPFKNVRDRVISQDLLERLKEYLRFRHLFRNVYGFEIKWQRFKPLVLSMSTVLNDFKKNIREFMGSLESQKKENEK